MPDEIGSRRAAIGCLAGLGFFVAGACAGGSAANACVIAWWQPLGSGAGTWIEYIGAFVGAGSGVFSVLGLWMLIEFLAFSSKSSQAENPKKARVLSFGAIGFVLLIAFGALVLIGLGGLKWKEVSPAGSGFKVMLPGTPIEQEQGEDTPQGRASGKRFLSQAHDRFQLYAVGFADYPEEYVKRNSAEVLFKSQIDELVPSEGKRVSENSITLSGFPGKDLQLETGDGGSMVFRMYLVKQRFFMLVAQWHNSNRPREVDTFFDSFTFTK